MLAEKGSFRGELTYQRGDGRRVYLEARITLFDGDGKQLGHISVNRDITERRYADEAINQLVAERGAHGTGGGAATDRP